jgi:hypothetical protein
MQNRLNRPVGASRSPSIARAVFSIVFVVILASAFGCASGRVSNLDAYDEIQMNRVVPYPSTDEMRKRAFEIVLVDRPAVGIEEGLLEKPRAQVRRALEGIGAEAGAMIIDRSLQEIGGIRTEGVLGELEGREGEKITGADYALATRFSNYRYRSEWKRPFKFLWQSLEDVADKPGTCTHIAEVEVDVQVIEIGSNDRVTKTYSLEHNAVQKNKDLDPACTIAPVTLGVLFERALDESLSCLNLPLGTLLSPRGHVTKHRKAPDAERHIYRISLGAAQGMRKGDEVEIRREQRSMSPAGEENRSERVIGVGEVTDLVMPQVAWIAADPTGIAEDILDGDVIRPLLSEGLLSSLSGPNCREILKER